MLLAGAAYLVVYRYCSIASLMHGMVPGPLGQDDNALRAV